MVSKGKSNRNTQILWQLERGIYCNWQTSNVAFGLPTVFLHIDQTSNLRETAFVAHRDCSTDSASLKICVLCLPLCLHKTSILLHLAHVQVDQGLARFQATDSVQLTELLIKVWALSVLWHNLHYLKSLWVLCHWSDQGDHAGRSFKSTSGRCIFKDHFPACAVGFTRATVRSS